MTSKKDQQQYWVRRNEPYRFIPSKEFAEAYQSFHVGRKVAQELSVPYDKSKNHPAALTTEKYGVSKKEFFKACMSRELLLMKRNSFVYIFKLVQVCPYCYSFNNLFEENHILRCKITNICLLITCYQLIIMAFVAMTVFFRTEMPKRDTTDGNIFTGALFFSVVMIMFNGMAEMSMTIAKLPVFYKQRDLLFFPAWAYALPSWFLKIPITFFEVAVWVFTTYYVTGFDPNVGRYLHL